MTSFVADDDLAQALAEMDIPTFDDFNESDDDDAPLTSKEVSLYADSPPSPSPSTFPVAHLYKSVYSQSYSRTPTQTSAIESLVREMGFDKIKMKVEIKIEQDFFENLSMYQDDNKTSSPQPARKPQ